MKIENIIMSNKMPLGRKTAINLMYTTNVLHDRTSEILKPFDLSTQQFNVLRILRGQKGKPANLSTIQERMITKMSNTTRLVDKLLAKGLVCRVTCEANRRKVEITITQKGLDVLSELDKPIDDQHQAMIKNVSKEELEQFNLILEKLRDSE
ncbi:MarR family winged helix-turn-helix transcriptional regulator [Galbibacter mesophilus]|uniref:MarR family winged helix-turn-helix transcriptional regulator n=1 Tax=Galbibacter mesophilus TaxID=379069 RepID=UPI00191F1A44|nr:MarR family transcriptional regulator [Galbibacter mesophilus]MCM5661629.1 MarR family transcriptional regulator [Galbibacter mesophilus]